MSGADKIRPVIADSYLSIQDQDATSGTSGQADRRWLSASARLDERCDKADIPEEWRLWTLAGIHGKCEPGYGCFCRANRHFWQGQVSFEGKRLGYPSHGPVVLLWFISWVICVGGNYSS